MTTRLERVVGNGRQLAGGRYVVRHPIGTPGGEGAVYRALDRRRHRDVAIKVIHPGLYGMFRDAFDAQIDFLATVDNPWCIEVHDHFIIPPSDGWQETAALVMRLADHSLADLIRPGGVGRAVAIEATRNAAAGLAELHRRGGTHNDVKPHNLLHVSDDGPPRWVLSDFGVAKRLDGTHAYQQSMDMRYAPPERIRWGQVRRPGDVFSLGMTFHEALCGELPGGFGDYVVSPTLDRHAADLVRACLQPDPADRPGLDEVEAALARMATEPVEPTSAQEPTVPVRPRRAVTLPPASLAGTAPVAVDRTWIAPPPPPVPATERPPEPRRRSRKQRRAAAEQARPARPASMAPPAPTPVPTRPPGPARAPKQPKRRRRRPIRALLRVTVLLGLLVVGTGAAAELAPDLARMGADRLIGELLDRADEAVGGGFSGVVEASPPELRPPG